MNETVWGGKFEGKGAVQVAVMVTFSGHLLFYRSRLLPVHEHVYT